MDLNALRNPWTIAARKNLHDVMKEKYVPHDPIVERIANNFQTQKDLEDFFHFVNALYQSGFHTCLEQYKTELERRGIKVDLKTN